MKLIRNRLKLIPNRWKSMINQWKSVETKLKLIENHLKSIEINEQSTRINVFIDFFLCDFMIIISPKKSIWGLKTGFSICESGNTEGPSILVWPVNLEILKDWNLWTSGPFQDHGIGTCGLPAHFKTMGLERLGS